jgi:ComF family protein
MKAGAQIISSFRSMLHLFLPRCCAVCGKGLVEGESLLCTACRWNMPLTGSWSDPDNPIREKMHALIGAEQAASLFYYQKRSGYDQLIYRFKYQGRGSLSYALGRWLGEELKRSGLYSDIDVIVPVPLHPLRLIKRGYNQSELFARGIAAVLKVPVRSRLLIRKVHNRSQTHRAQTDRWENVAGIFALRSPRRLEGRHILLVDDVLTTGATLESCAEAIRARLTDCRLSVATLAVSSKDVFGKNG